MKVVPIIKSPRNTPKTNPKNRSTSPIADLDIQWVILRDKIDKITHEKRNKITVATICETVSILIWSALDKGDKSILLRIVLDIEPERLKAP